MKSVNKRQIERAKGNGGPGRCKSRERARNPVRDEEEAVKNQQAEASI